jgi:hypothetical protein
MSMHKVLVLSSVAIQNRHDEDMVPITDR